MERRIGWVVFVIILALVLGVCIYQEALAAQKKSSTTSTALPADAAEVRSLVGNYSSAGDTDNAVKTLEKVISSDQHMELKWWATLELYRIARENGKVPQVIADLEEESASNPDNLELKKCIAEGYVRLTDWTKVASIYEDLVQRKPDDYAFQTRLTDYYILAGQYDKAFSRLEPIVNENPDDSYHSDILANAYVKAGMQDKAIALYKRKIEKSPSSPGLRGRYAQALLDFGRLEESLKEWQKANELDPSNPVFQQRIDQISSQLGG